MAARAYLSLGTNLGDRRSNLQAALRALDHGPTLLAAVSPLYETEPVGVTDQPRFWNLAAAVDTDLDAFELLHHVKGIERHVGRTPTYRWGPRVVDIDIVLFGDQVIETDELTIPHREMARRAFVLIPLAGIAPGAIHPGLKVSVAELAAHVAGRESVQHLGTPEELLDN